MWQHISLPGGQPAGPVSDETVKAMLASGELDAERTHVRRVGRSAWQPICAALRPLLLIRGPGGRARQQVLFARGSSPGVAAAEVGRAGAGPAVAAGAR